MGTPAIFIGCLETAGIRIRMDGRGRALNGLVIERRWRAVKYEAICLKDYAALPELKVGLERYFRFYNHDRPHQSLQYRTPAGRFISVESPNGLALSRPAHRVP